MDTNNTSPAPRATIVANTLVKFLLIGAQTGVSGLWTSDPMSPLHRDVSTHALNEGLMTFEGRTLITTPKGKAFLLAAVTGLTA